MRRTEGDVRVPPPFLSVANLGTSGTSSSLFSVETEGKSNRVYSGNPTSGRARDLVSLTHSKEFRKDLSLLLIYLLLYFTGVKTRKIFMSLYHKLCVTSNIFRK